MRIRCIAEHPNSQQVQQLGTYYRPGKTVFPVNNGQQYTALGIGTWDGVHWVEVETPTEDVVSVPLFLFEIVDGTPSHLWEARVHEDGALTFWPSAFYHEFFHSRLSDDAPDVLAEFRVLKHRMAEE
ncbi:MAG TPA: hypothetical protein VF613_25670 [Longimicrobium sp.]|jgi:hypothetical protein